MVIGLDYSMSCPAACFGGHTFRYLLDKKTKKKFTKVPTNTLYDWGNPSIDGYEWSSKGISDQERWFIIGSWFVNFVTKDDLVVIEDYSYGSKGKSFHIAENCGLMKYLLWARGIAFKLISPSVVKKVATDNGSATKEQMLESFNKENNNMFLNSDVDSPINDMVDSYYLYKIGVNN